VYDAPTPEVKKTRLYIFDLKHFSEAAGTQLPSLTNAYNTVIKLLDENVRSSYFLIDRYIRKERLYALKVAIVVED
jgi:hypothetical protein